MWIIQIEVIILLFHNQLNCIFENTSEIKIIGTIIQYNEEAFPFRWYGPDIPGAFCFK